jgi:hypothetical protein
MGKEMGKPALRNIPSGKSANQTNSYAGSQNKTPTANQNEGRAGRPRYGSETLAVDKKAFNRHRELDTPNTSSWKGVDGSTGDR